MGEAVSEIRWCCLSWGRHPPCGGTLRRLSSSEVPSQYSNVVELDVSLLEKSVACGYMEQVYVEPSSYRILQDLSLLYRTNTREPLNHPERLQIAGQDSTQPLLRH